MAEELRNARIASGLSQGVAASAAGVSRAQWGRLERAELDPRMGQLTRAAAVLGLELSVRAYPDGDPLRDRAHLALLERFRRRLPRTATWRTEVPLPIDGDLRAWDALVTLDGRSVAVEAETRIADVQAVIRRLARKQRDGSLPTAILLVADTRTNRRALAESRPHLVELLPLEPIEVLRALDAGHLPERSGIAML